MLNYYLLINYCLIIFYSLDGRDGEILKINLNNLIFFGSFCILILCFLISHASFCVFIVLIIVTCVKQK